MKPKTQTAEYTKFDEMMGKLLVVPHSYGRVVTVGYQCRIAFFGAALGGRRLQLQNQSESCIDVRQHVARQLPDLFCEKRAVERKKLGNIYD